MCRISSVLVIFFLFLSCNNNDNPFEQIVNNDPAALETEPRYTGMLRGCIINEAAEPLNDDVSFPVVSPVIFDLSHLIPPVINQGEQANSPVFATTYYLKSYHEKIQHNYEYLSESEVMSPSFVYNQIKISENCNEGSCIENALYVLKNQGVNLWSDFPYSSESCTEIQTNAEEIVLAEANKIASYHNVLENSFTYSTVDIVKALILFGNPVIIGMKIDNNFKSAIPKITLNEGTSEEEEIYVYNECNQEINDNHAMLIVGYDDEFNAFKVVNSWGENWANEGYAYINYDFFLDESEATYKEGLLELFVAYDVE